MAAREHGSARRLLVVVTLLGLACGRDPQPDVILIVLDAADHLSLYGYPRSTMPALEALARDAIVELPQPSGGRRRGWCRAGRRSDPTPPRASAAAKSARETEGTRPL
jgi:hypothetical protein